MYTWNLLSLWAGRKITWPTVIYALKSQPIAVAGRDGSYHIDPHDSYYDDMRELNIERNL